MKRESVPCGATTVRGSRRGFAGEDSGERLEIKNPPERKYQIATRKKKTQKTEMGYENMMRARCYGDGRT